MRRVVLAFVVATVVVACGSKLSDNSRASVLTKHLPATLEVDRPRTGDPRAVKIRVYADTGIRALPKWRDEITDQVDYANQLLTPLVGARLVIAEVKDWDRAGDPGDALAALAALDPASDVTWVVGYVTAGDSASTVLAELGRGEPLGRHVALRGWAEHAETTALASKLPDLGEAERTELIAAHRRHKQTVVLLRALAATLGAVGETDKTWIQHPRYSSEQFAFSERNRELIGLGIDERLATTPDLALAQKLLTAIEKTAWGGWIPAEHDHVTATLRNVIDAGKAGRTAAAVPSAAYDQYNRIRELARRGKPKDALIELDNLLAAYPGNAAMHQLRCEIMIGANGVADPTTRTACKRASELAPGDPTPHLAVAEALLRAGDNAGARAELTQAEATIGNLTTGATDAWRKLIAVYQGMGALTWTEQAIAKAKLEGDPVAAQIASTRARYGIARGGKLVAPEDEAALVAAVRAALDLVYASKYGEAERSIAQSERRWPRAPGLLAARCDLALRLGQVHAARAACDRALAGDPNASWALYLSGVILLREAGTTPAGIDRLKRAIAVDPELAQAWRTLGKAYARGNDKQAHDQLSRDYQAKFGTPLPP